MFFFFLSYLLRLDSTFEIASGGDDNAVFTSKFLICENQNSLSCDVIWTDRNKFAHHSTITGIHSYSFPRPSFVH